ncbi:MAG: SDH family Clp fold serine proteinase [Thermoproteota archaeon]
MPNIMPQDVPIFEDMLRVSSKDTKADLIINSPGGDPNTAEKILMMCRARFKEEFNVIVPNFAKSAATMVALGSDKIFMGYLSELGPIDPQVPIPLPTGQVQYVPARTYLDGLERIRQWIAKGHPPQVYLPILSQIRPEMIKLCEDAIDFSKEFLKRWLPKGTLKHNQEKVDEVIEAFVSGTKYKSHSQVINYEEAKKLGLNVEFIEPQSELWNLVWELYVRSIHFLSQTRNAAKLFETDTSSITMNIEVIPVQARSSEPHCLST